MTTSASAYGIRLIVNSALWLTVAGIVVRSCGAIREIIFASFFGVSKDTDAFFLALTYATFVPLILASALSTSLVTQLANMSRGAALPRGGGLLDLMQKICIAALVAGLGIYFFAPLALPLLFNLEDAELEKAVLYSRILAPLGLTMTLSASLDALLNSAKRFFIAGITSAATPLTMIVAVVYFGEPWGIQAAAWGMTAGGVFEVFILVGVIFLQRRALFSDTTVASVAPGNVAFWRSVAFLAFSAAIAAVSPVVDQIFLSRLETGAISSFNYASKVNGLLIGLFGTAFGVAIYPYLSDLAAQRDHAGLKHLAWRITALVVPITVVASGLVFFFSYEIVDLLFARGNFTAADTLTVGYIQRIFAFQLTFYVAGLVAMRILNAVGAADSVFWISCIGMTLNALFDWLFYTSMGAGGIAMSSVLTSVASLLFALLFIRAALKNRPA